MTYVACDTETTGLHLYHGAAPFMVCTLSDEEEYRTWEWPVDPITRNVLYDNRVEELANFLEGKDVIFHHADFDLRALRRMGISLSSPVFNCYSLYGGKTTEVSSIHDTQLLSHVVNSMGTGDFNSESGRHALKPLSLFYLDIPESDEDELRKATISARRMGKQLGWSLGVGLDGDSQIEADYWMSKAVWDYFQNELIPEDDVPAIVNEWPGLCEKYCRQDCYRTIGLFFLLQEILQRDGLQSQYDKAMRVLPVTHLMENFGLHCIPEALEPTHREFLAKAEATKLETEKRLCQICGIDSLNANAGQQLAEALIKGGLPLSERTSPSKAHPSGQWKTDKSTIINLAQYCEYHPDKAKLKEIGEVLRIFIGYDAELDKEYCEEHNDEKSIPGYKTYKTGASYVTGYKVRLDRLFNVHCSYNQVGTSWTRYSCTDPNGQNVSKKAVLPLRKLFGPPPGYVWFAIDYSQLELRIYAYASKDTGLIQSFADGYDFHTFTAMSMYGLPADKISPEQRRAAKAVNFGIIFGSGPAKVDASSGRPGTYMTYMQKFPNAKSFIQGTIRKVEKDGYVETMGGYRLYVRPDKTYAGANGVVQGTAGEIVKNAMVEIHEKQLVDWAPPTPSFPYGGSAIVANIHDEIIFQIPESYPYQAIGRRLMQEMEDAGKNVGVITPVDAKLITTNWAEGEKFVV